MTIEIMKHKIGENSIWTSCFADGDEVTLLGTFNKNGKYGIMLAAMDEKGTILWEREHEIECNCEANAILKESEGYLIGGNACGIPTDQGGRDWKAYLMRTDEKGDAILDRTYELGENSAIYSISRSGTEIFSMGETEKEGKKYVFLMRTDDCLNPLRTKYFGPYENVLVGGISENIAAFSFMQAKEWYGRILEIDKNMEDTELISEIGGVQIYSIDVLDGDVLISGEKEGDAYAARIFSDGDTVESIMGTGVITRIRKYREGALLVGDLKDVPYIAVADGEMHIVEEHTEELAGWFEDGCQLGSRILAAGYSMKDKEAFALLLERNDKYSLRPKLVNL